jgi:hypothetical protein
MTTECPREHDVLDALAATRWPDRCDQELREHVRACVICRDLADVAAALLEDQDAAWREAHVPPSGVVWWRAQLRAREEAARAAARPLAFIQGVAASVAVWLVVALVRAVPAEYFAEWRGWIAAAIPQAPWTIPEMTHITAAMPLVVLAIVAAWLLLAPLLYLVADE